MLNSTNIKIMSCLSNQSRFHTVILWWIVLQDLWLHRGEKIKQLLSFNCDIEGELKPPIE